MESIQTSPLTLLSLFMIAILFHLREWVLMDPAVTLHQFPFFFRLGFFSRLKIRRILLDLVPTWSLSYPYQEKSSYTHFFCPLERSWHVLFSWSVRLLLVVWPCWLPPWLITGWSHLPSRGIHLDMVWRWLGLFLKIFISLTLG